ncbi:hypothetical protein FQR65_LT04334 [Abscondita terminalis]|nr:hypothetical protein FQR65_LT04334 [Abscondita terminalis]
MLKTSKSTKYGSGQRTDGRTDGRTDEVNNHHQKSLIKKNAENIEIHEVRMWTRTDGRKDDEVNIIIRSFESHRCHLFTFLFSIASDLYTSETSLQLFLEILSKMSCQVIEIDGSMLEGGGQILRIAVTLSVLLQQPIRVVKIRAGRSKPGLMEQHLKGLELVTQICNGKLKGGSIGSTEIELWPGKIFGGNYTAIVKTAGSISLLLQISLPCILFANSDTYLTLGGGTNAEMAPQVDYTTEVFRPILEKFGATFDFDLVRRGYFPKGGGLVKIHVQPVARLKAVELLEIGNVSSIHGWSFVAGTLPMHLSHTMAKSASNNLSKLQRNVQIETYKEDNKIAPDNGSGIILVATTNTGCIIGGSALGRRNEKPEQSGTKAADEILESFHEGACLDKHSQDQVIILMALAEGRSRIRVGEITLHTKTAIHVVEKLSNVRFDIVSHENGNIIECDGLGLTRGSE